MPREIGGGVMAETVGDILDGDWSAHKVADPVQAPRLPGQPEWPGEGIFFGMPEADYHAIHAFSNSGIKVFAASPADYWEDSVLNPDREERGRKDYFDFGNAIHCLVLEGEEVYANRYVIGLEKPKDVLENADQIKARIAELGHKPCSKGYDDISRSAKKEDWINQLLDLDPEAQIWDRIKATFDAEHEGAEVITHKIDRRVRIAAKMILGQADIAENFRDGYPEVSIFWHCPATGCPLKARIDFLKLDRIVDLKSYSGKSGRPVDQAILREIASYYYNIQQVVYIEAVEAAKALIREKGEYAIHSNMNTPGLLSPDARSYIVEWCFKWAKRPEPDYLLVLQKSTKAPVTRGKLMPRESMGVYGVTKRRVEELKRAFIAHCEVYGCEQWLDIQPITEIDDLDLPIWSTEF
jgi:hypothetical protein